MHLVGILFPHINDDARSKPHQVYIYDVGHFFALARLPNLKRFSQQTASLHLCRTAILTTKAITWNWHHYFMLAYQKQNDSTTKLIAVARVLRETVFSK